MKRSGVAMLYAALWRHAEGQRGRLLAALALLGGSELLRLLPPWLGGQAMNAIQRHGAASMGEGLRNLLLMFAALLLGWVLHAPGRLIERNVAMRVRASHSRLLLARVLGAPLSWHRAHHSAETTHRIVQSSDALHQFAENQYIYLQNLVLLAGPVVALWLIDRWVGLAATLGYATIALASLAYDRVLTRLSDESNQAQRRYSTAWTDMLGNLFTIVALRRFSGAEALTWRRLQELFAPLRRIIWLNEAKWASVDLLGAALWCTLVALYAMRHWHDGTGGLALGSVYMVYEYGRRAETVMSVIAADFSTLAQQLANYASADPVLAAPQVERVDALAPTAWRTLSMEAVTLRHPAGLRDGVALAEARFTLQRGRRYAVVGASGAGKTSLLALLAGIEAPSAGTLRLDGRAVGSAALRREATLIPQGAEMMLGDLGDNLTLGATIGHAEIASALAMVDAGALFGTADGMAAEVAEGGANFSGGQRQRVALARGLLAARGSSLVLFDEPANGLDPAAEAELVTRLLCGFPGSTVVVALHRLSLLDRVDEVIVMADGRVVDVATTADLARRCAVFRNLAGLSAALADTPPPFVAQP